MMELSALMIIMIVLMAGLPGTGKTTLAHVLAERTTGRVLSKDEFRHAIFACEEIEYSSRQDDFVLQLMLETAAYLLSRNPGRTIFLDPSFLATVSDRECAGLRRISSAALENHRVRLFGRDRPPAAGCRFRGQYTSCGKPELSTLRGSTGKIRSIRAAQDRN
jgi:predicted ATPase